MSEIQVFKDKRFGEIRVIEKDGQPWFVARDVCDSLSISKYRDAVSKLEGDERGLIKMDTPGGKQEMNIISESGMYTLILRSNKPAAKSFRRWVTSEVLPQIRRTGAYAVRQAKVVVANALLVANELLQEQRQKIIRISAECEEQARILKAQAPAIEAYNIAIESKDTISMAEAEKLINIKGMGQNVLFRALRNNGILQKDNIPYQKYINRKWFKVIEQPYMKNDVKHIRLLTRVTHKGVMGIWRLINEVGFSVEGPVEEKTSEGA